MYGEFAVYYVLGVYAYVRSQAGTRCRRTPQCLRCQFAEALLDSLDTYMCKHVHGEEIFGLLLSMICPAWLADSIGLSRDGLLRSRVSYVQGLHT